MLRAANAQAVSASISTPVDSVATTLADTSTPPSPSVSSTFDVAQEKRVAEGNDLGGSLGGEDTRHARDVHDFKTVAANLDARRA